MATLWKPLFESGVEIDFAHRTFRWDSEAHEKAHVHCVIVGFHVSETTEYTECTEKKSSVSSVSSVVKKIFDGDKVIDAGHINGYLMDGPDAWVESRTKPICDVPGMGIGNKPIDGGNYLFLKEEMEDFVKKEPLSAKYFRPWYGAEEFINGKERFCLWLGDCSQAELFKMPECLKRVQAVRDFRLASKSEGTRKIAAKPTRFHVENMPKGNYLLVPSVSSERRQYVPIGFMSAETIASNLVLIIPSATLYHFGVLTSSVHMAWMRVVAGRLKSDYRYSANIVYNNFPWPECESDFNHAEHVDHVEGSESGYLAPSSPSSQSGEGETSRTSRTSREAKSEAGKNLHVSACSTRLKNIPAIPCGSLRSLRQKIETAAQSILDARALYPGVTFAQMYGDKMYLFPELAAAHAANDRAVLAAYGLAPDTPESEIVSHLMRRYQEMTAK